MKQFMLVLFILFFNVAGLHSGNSAKLFVQSALNQVIQAQEALKGANAGVNGLQGVRTSRAFLLQARIFLRSAKKAHEGGEQGAVELQGLSTLQPPASAPREQRQPIEVVGGTFDPRAAIEAALRRDLLSLSSSFVGARNEPQSIMRDRVDHQRGEHQERQAVLRSSKRVQAGAQNQHKLSTSGEVQATLLPSFVGDDHEGQRFGCAYCPFRSGTKRWVKRHQLDQHQGQDVKIVDHWSGTESDCEVSQQQEALALSINQRKRAINDEEQGSQEPVRKRQRVDEATRSKQHLRNNMREGQLCKMRVGPQKQKKKKKPFECSHCRGAGLDKFLFSSRFNARRHHKRVHKGLPLSIRSLEENEGNDIEVLTQQEPSDLTVISSQLEKSEKTIENQRNLTCTECGRRFFHRSNLSRHKYAVHKKEVRFRCGYCNKCSSIRRSNVRRHQEVKHPGKAENIIDVRLATQMSSE